jgi:glycosyltransferase involved in cell wall biosynthesis
MSVPAISVPFVLSGSFLDALACGTTVLASNTASVRELIQDRQNGRLVDCFDIEGLADRATQVRDNPSAYRRLGHPSFGMIRDRNSLEVCLRRMLDLYEEARRSRGGDCHLQPGIAGSRRRIAAHPAPPSAWAVRLN